MYYDFGLERIIRDQLFTYPEYCDARGQHRDFSEAGYYGSADARRINDLTDGLLFDADSSTYEVGMDWGQPYTFAKTLHWHAAAQVNPPDKFRQSHAIWLKERQA